MPHPLVHRMLEIQRWQLMVRMGANMEVSRAHRIIGCKLVVGSIDRESYLSARLLLVVPHRDFAPIEGRQSPCPQRPAQMPPLVVRRRIDS